MCTRERGGYYATMNLLQFLILCGILHAQVIGKLDVRVNQFRVVKKYSLYKFDGAPKYRRIAMQQFIESF